MNYTGYNSCSTNLCIRLTHNELKTLDKLKGNHNRTEYIRYLIISEEQRRHGEGRARPAQYMSDMRNGRTKNDRPDCQPQPLWKQMRETPAEEL